MGIEFELGHLEIVEIIDDKITATEHYLKADEEHLKELKDDKADIFVISVARHAVLEGRRRIKSLKLYAKSVALGAHIFTLAEIKDLEKL